MLFFPYGFTGHGHLELIKSKAWTRINIMRKLKFKLVDRKSLQTIYFSFIRLLLEYADVVWNNCTQYESHELEKIQNEAARIITGTSKLVSINSLLLEKGWETLASRTNKLNLLSSTNWKMTYHVLDYFCSLVPATAGCTSLYPLRNASNLQTLHANSQLYYNSVLPSVVRDWNQLPEQIRTPSLNVFKERINDNVSTPPLYDFV